MQKVIVIGCPGAGKSTFARMLRDKTHLPLYYLDMIWHKPDRTNISRQEFDRKLDEILSQDEWIIDGNYSRTLDARIKACDTVFFLDFSAEVCIQGAKERVGTPREDMPWVEETLDEEFRERIETFAERELANIYLLLEKHKHKNIIIFKSREDTEAYLKNMI